MRRAGILLPKTLQRCTVWTVLLAAAIAAIWLSGLGGTSVAPAAAAAETVWWLDCPTTSVLEGDQFTVYLKRLPTSGDQNRHFYTYWSTEEGTASSNDFTPLDRVRQSTRDGDGERAANSMPRVIYTTADPRVEHDETFTVRISEGNIRDMNDPDYDDKCEITIRNDDKFKGDIGVSTDGTKITITLNEGLKHHLLLNWLVNKFDFPINLFHRAVFDVKVDNRWTVPEDASLSGNKITLTMAEPITEGQSVKVRYGNVFAKDSLGMFMNGAGITFPNFDATPATWNSSTVADASGGPGPWMPLNKSELTIDEGGSGSFKVKLNKSPSGSVTVDVSNYPTGTSSGTDSLSLDKDTLTFNRSNWNQEQTVTATAPEDSDAVNFWSLVTLSASSGGYQDYETYVKVLVKDNDLLVFKDVDPAAEVGWVLSMDEGESKTYRVKLKTRPAERVDVALTSSWAGMTISPASLLFNKNNWSSYQTVTLTAGDVDSVHSANIAVTVQHTPSGAGYGDDHQLSLTVLVYY